MTAHGPPDRPSLRLPDALRAAVEAAIARAVDERWASRLWAHGHHALDHGPGGRRDHREPPRLARCARRVHGRGRGAGGVRRGHPRAPGFTDAVVCGMGGSSLAPEVLATGPARGPRSGLRVHVLDSTDPAAVARRSTPRRAPRRPCASSPPSPARRPRRSPSWPTSGRPSSTGSARFHGQRGGRLASWPSPTRATASRRSPTATCSGSRSSTRPTWAAATAR